MLYLLSLGRINIKWQHQTVMKRSNIEYNNIVGIESPLGDFRVTTNSFIEAQEPPVTFRSLNLYLPIRRYNAILYSQYVKTI